ncbi:hypothetical protein BpOF4_21289 (plasmid) [Alkalihalophilus pseudofirmus OF4]|uniref:Uncharacterized protein n=1 Tax=Alkalihalophilus pseudofirmus (strain ATCC BAA-2126 / JCM 17055 / OF4) TaxID=398511 RepID=D3G1M7_ALKPO|nr:hypothetical protein [Alkalihalophilus pseudofirmus]ADC52253.1 hypothetical protein BpOF4_21289 [Alkalihalophilus pseudofirmus OF4]
MIDFSKYPTTLNLINQVEDLKDQPEKIKWLHLSKEEIATAIAKQYILSECLRSTHLTFRRKANHWNKAVHENESSKVHSFARTEAMDQLQLSYEDVVRLFPESELGGKKHIN